MMYGLSLKPIDSQRWAREQQEHDREVCKRYSKTSYKLERVVEGATLGPVLPVFPLMAAFAFGGPKHGPLVLSAVSALTVVPFIMKLPMRKASYGRRAAIGNAILATAGAFYGLRMAREEQKRMCKR
jgi:hypothetical protein